eukprot:4066356-Amphidinium_carterae.1
MPVRPCIFSHVEYAKENVSVVNIVDVVIVNDALEVFLDALSVVVFAVHSDPVLYEARCLEAHLRSIGLASTCRKRKLRKIKEEKDGLVAEQVEMGLQSSASLACKAYTSLPEALNVLTELVGQMGSLNPQGK